MEIIMPNKNKESGPMGNLLKSIVEILLKPHYFFSQKMPQEQLRDSLMFYRIIVFVSVLLAFIFQTLAIHNIGYIRVNFYLGDHMPIITSFIAFIITLAVVFYAIYLVAAILHGFVLLFSGKGAYKDTLKVLAYSFSMAMIIGLIPFIGQLLGTFWLLVLLVVGFKITHRYSYFMAILTTIMPGVLIMTTIMFLSQKSAI